MNEEKTIEQIKAGESAEATWNFSVRADVETKSYKTPFQITYDDGTNIYETNKFIYVNTTAKKTADTPKADPTPTPDTTQKYLAMQVRRFMMQVESQTVTRLQREVQIKAGVCHV